MYSKRGVFATWYKESMDAFLYIISFALTMFIIYIIKKSDDLSTSKPDGRAIDVKELYSYLQY